MISFEKASGIVQQSAYTIGVEAIPMMESLQRILAEDVYSDIDMPPFDKSAMDGYACRRSDVEKNAELSVIETIPAGKVPEKKVGPGECAKIMTGSMVPGGADWVVMVENTRELPDQKVQLLEIGNAPNISRKGEDVKINDKVLAEGILIGPQHIAVMAGVGYSQVKVYGLPKVGILVTGNELVEPNQKPALSQIRNSNSYQLKAQILQMGITPVYYGIIADDENSTLLAIEKALEENDVILITGGVSMGDFDFVPAILEKCGVEIKFDSIAVQPGKPTTFGVKEKKRCFGLPGNPVSSFIQFDFLVKPLLYSMMGHSYQPAIYTYPMGVDFTRKRAERKSFVPVMITSDQTVIPVEYHGSAHIHALSKAMGILTVEVGQMHINKGELVHVRPL